MCGWVLARGRQGSGRSGRLGARAAQRSASSQPRCWLFLLDLLSAQSWQGLPACGPVGSGMRVSASQLDSPHGLSSLFLRCPLAFVLRAGDLEELWPQLQELEHKMWPKINQ